ncbi:MAG: chorismate-binding protein [Flavobacteriales bacterium]|nr:chorismate-binding protein [Flavobacteriales bacterium]
MNDHGQLREALHRCLSKGLTFAAFRRPDQPVEIWAQRTPDLEFIDGGLMLELNEAFLIAPFDLSSDRVPFIRSDVQLLFGELGPDIALLNACEGSTGPNEAVPRSTEESIFQDAVESAVSAIACGAMQKVVLSRTLNTPLAGSHLPDLYINAMHEHPDAFVALAHTPLHGTWIGASPEHLVFEEEDRVRVDALAGTLPIGIAPTEPHAWSEKERNEQMLVTESVLDTFLHLEFKEVIARGPTVVHAGQVAHLRTFIHADLDDRMLGDLVLALHPTPAVCGSPKAAAKTFIAAHEQHDRALYAGFWGPWSPDGFTELFVNIRCMRVFEGEAVLYVGAGIVADSDPKAEWDETEQKAQTWLRAIAALK